MVDIKPHNAYLLQQSLGGGGEKGKGKNSCLVYWSHFLLTPGRRHHCCDKLPMGGTRLPVSPRAKSVLILWRILS